MNEELRERIEDAVETNALFNALKHESDAQLGPLMGPMMGENPEFREHGDELPQIAAPVIERVNDYSERERRDRLAEIAPETLAELEAEEAADDEHPLLPALPNQDDYDDIRMRVAPNPNGPWHLGNARMPAVVGTYKQLTDGWFACRFDDTDPETKRPRLDAYEAILESIDYLGFEPDRVVRASDRVERYYESGRELIESEGAYTCSCPAGEFSERKAEAEPCPHRGKAIETSLEEFEAMVAGDVEAGDRVLRVRTDIEAANPALRDWVAFRMVETPHPREEAAEYRCWPMLDFQSAIDDHDLKITHIIRGIDLQDSAKSQQFVYDYFDWEYPEVLHWGRIEVEEYDVPLSTSSISDRIESGALSGWDDPRAPTLASLERRGIRGPAITEAMVELGTSTSNATLSMSAIYAANRELVEDSADRCFFVRDGVEKPVIGAPEQGEPPRHPNHEQRGVREIPVGGAVRIEPADVPANGQRVWLKGLGCLRHTRDALEFTGEDIDVVREGDVDVIHWVPADESVPVQLQRPEELVSGYAEPGFSEYAEETILQFERIGFVRVDSQAEEESVVYFAHQ